MTATVAFTQQSGPPVAVLPASALTESNAAPAVWVLNPAAQTASLRPVVLAGYAPDGSVLISAGLNAGDQVITAGLHHIVPGMRLTAWQGPMR